MSQSMLLQWMVLLSMLLIGCSDGRAQAERVRAFCESIKVGELFEAVDARSMTFQLQPGGFAPDPRERLAKTIAPETLNKVSGILYEPQGRIEKERPIRGRAASLTMTGHTHSLQAAGGTGAHPCPSRQPSRPRAL